MKQAKKCYGYPPSKEPQKAKKPVTPPQASRHFTKSHHLEYKTFIFQLYYLFIHATTGLEGHKIPRRS